LLSGYERPISIVKEFLNMIGGQKPLIHIHNAYEDEGEEFPEEQIVEEEDISGLDYNTPQIKYLQEKGLQDSFIKQLMRESGGAKDHVFDALGDLFAKPSGDSLDKRFRFFVYNIEYLNLHANRNDIAKDIKDIINSNSHMSKLFADHIKTGLKFSDFIRGHTRFFNSVFENLLPKYSKILDGTLSEERLNEVLKSPVSNNVLEIYQAIFQRDIDDAVKSGDLSKSNFFQTAKKISVSKMNIEKFGPANTQSFEMQGRDDTSITVEDVGNIKERQGYREQSEEQKVEEKEYLLQSLKTIFYDKTEQLRNYARSCADHIEGLALDSLEEAKSLNEEFKKDTDIINKFYSKDSSLKNKVSKYYRNKIINNIDNANAKFSQSDYFRILGEAALFNADRQFNEIKSKDTEDIKNFINKVKNKNYIQSSLRSINSFYSFSQKLSKNRISILETQQELWEDAYKKTGSFNEANNRSGPTQVATVVNSKREKPFSENFITSVLNRPLTDIDIQKMLQKIVADSKELTEEDIKKMTDFSIRNLARNGYLYADMFSSESSKEDSKELRRRIANKILYQYNTFYVNNQKSIPSLEHLVPNAAISLLGYVASEDEGYNSQLRRDLLNLTNYHIMHMGGDQRVNRKQTANFSLITEVGSRIDKTQEPIQIREGLYRTRITRPETLYLMYGIKMPKFLFDQVNDIYMTGRQQYSNYLDFKQKYDEKKKEFMEKGTTTTKKKEYEEYVKKEIEYKGQIGNMISDKEYEAFLKTWEGNIAETAVISFSPEGEMVKDGTKGSIKREVELTKDVLIFMHKSKDFSPIEKTAFSIIENIFNKYASKIEKLVSINKKLNKQASTQYDINLAIKGIIQDARREFESITRAIEDQMRM
jgi:hypothetical protein